MKYRSRTDIITAILGTAEGGATKTRLMYGAFLSYSQMKEYLEFLLAKNLISYEEGTGTYRPTEDGMNLLRTFEGINQLITVTDSTKPDRASRWDF